MRLLDLAANPKIAQYTELLRRASTFTDPVDVQREFATMLRNDALVHGFISLSVRGLDKGQYKITRQNLDDDMGQVTGNPWRDFASMPVHTGGFLGDMIASPEPKVVLGMHVPNDPVLGTKLARFGSCFVNPLYDDGEATNWSITLRFDPAGYTLADAETFLLRGNIIGRMTKTLVVAKQVKELNAKLQEQLEQIASIQRSLLPEQLPKAPGLSIAASYVTSNEAGGDYYDFFDMGDGNLGVMIADVSGHGAGAATVMAMLQTILHGFQERTRGPAAMLAHANRELFRKRFESQFVTAFFGVFDRDRQLLTFANAGHPPPALRRRTGEVLAVEGAGSVPLGIIDEPEYEHSSAPVQAGDTFVLFTDGITEAHSPPPERDMFGFKRLSAALKDCSGQPDCVIDSIHEKLYEHTQSRARADDQTIVALRVEDR